MKQISLTSDIDGGFWKRLTDLNAEAVLPYQLRVLAGEEPGLPMEQQSPVIENFRIAAGKSNGEYHGKVYYDSDLAKWLEAVAYSLRTHPNPALEAAADELIELVGESQDADGYLGTYFQVLAPEKRLKHFAFSCELYNAGHMMEAAAAYYASTGKRRLLDITCRMADLLCRIIGGDKGQVRVYDGHAEIELGLYRLYQATGKRRYLDLCSFFVSERGRQPCFFLEEPLLGDNDTGANDKWFGPDHHQAHMPVCEQLTAEGHAVKRMYLCCAMADLVAEGLDAGGHLMRALKATWESTVRRRMYITGGIGSQGYAERFTTDYDLPDDRPYTETCASIGLVFWAWRMLRLTRQAAYADEMERALYNNVLSGIGLNGTEYFYVNPLYVNEPVTGYRADTAHVKTRRQKWYECACCPPNIARLLGKVRDFLGFWEGDTLYTGLYADGSMNLCCGGKSVHLACRTNYPWEGRIDLCVTTSSPTAFTLALRIPAWCRRHTILLNDEAVSPKNEGGYALIHRRWTTDDRISLILEMTPRYVIGHPRCREQAGKAALMVGPLVYCFEQEDNGCLDGLYLSSRNVFYPVYKERFLGGCTVLKGRGFRDSLSEDGELYRDFSRSSQYMFKEVPLAAVPYHLWGNRQSGQMAVWLPFHLEIKGAFDEKKSNSSASEREGK